MSNQTGKKSRANGEGGIVHVPGSQNWYMIYRVDGKQHKVTTGTTDEAEALKQLKEKLETLHVDSRRGVTPVENFKNVKYEDIRDPYIQNFKNNNGDVRLRADGSEDIRGIRELNKYFEGKRVIQITPDEIYDYIDSRREDDVSGPAIRRELTVLRAMMNLAKGEERLGGMQIPKFPMPADSGAAGTYISPREFSKILGHLPENLRLFFVFLYNTACREGAARKITWGMVSKDRDLIRLPGSITKNGEPLDIPLKGATLEPITKMLKTAFAADDKPVFDSTNYRTEWNRAVAKVGLGTFDKETRQRTGVRIHDCRVSAAMNMIRAGLAQVRVMEIGGWKTVSVFKRYNIRDNEQTAIDMEKAGDYVDSRMNGTD